MVFLVARIDDEVVFSLAAIVCFLFINPDELVCLKPGFSLSVSQISLNFQKFSKRKWTFVTAV